MNTKNKTLILALLLAAGVACGYSKPKTTMPTISQLSPGTANAGDAQFQLEVDGTNFAAHAVVNFNGMAEPKTVVNASKLEAMIPSSAIMNAGIVPVPYPTPARAAYTAWGRLHPDR